MSEKEWINAADKLPSSKQLCEVKMILNFKGYYLPDVDRSKWMFDEDSHNVAPELLLWRPVEEKPKKRKRNDTESN